MQHMLCFVSSHASQPAAMLRLGDADRVGARRSCMTCHIPFLSIRSPRERLLFHGLTTFDGMTGTLTAILSSHVGHLQWSIWCSSICHTNVECRGKKKCLSFPQQGWKRRVHFVIYIYVCCNVHGRFCACLLPDPICMTLLRCNDGWMLSCFFRRDWPTFCTAI